MKVLALIFTLFSISNIFSQNIEVDYSVTINNDKRGRAINTIESLNFKLLANRSESLYKISENLSIKNELNHQLAKALVDGFNEYYVNILKKEIITRKEFYNEFFLITSNILDTNWKITNQTKKINNYLCYKATKVIQQKDKNKNLINTKIIAWFCPEINYPFGPVGFHGLPGLILELHKGRAIHFVKKIKFIENNINITKPTKGNNITEKEFEGLLDKLIKTGNR